MPQPISQPTYPSNMTEGDLSFSKLMDVLIADFVYFGIGTYDQLSIETLYATQASVKTELSTNFDLLGELAEKPGKTDSKLTKLKTRNYTIPGKRTNTIELNISGLSTKQKNFLESTLFMGKDTTIVVASKELDRVVIFTGLRWTVDWSGEADGLFNVVISTEFSGVTSNKIFLLKDIPPGV
ncbi:MAG TPA: hypothetical protein PLQ79_08705 [Candidatus Cloacimonadota bacterium]|nr:hypothetical protein [Candidatus Cloacimonadota bacterium]